MVSRVRLHYCKIILATSLVWFLLDVFILMYFTDCAANSVNTNCKQEHHEESRKQQDSGGFLGKLLPKGAQRESERERRRKKERERGGREKEREKVDVSDKGAERERQVLSWFIFFWVFFQCMYSIEACRTSSTVSQFFKFEL